MQTACFRDSYTPASSPRIASAIPPPPSSIPGHPSAKLSLREVIYTPLSSPGHATGLRSPYIGTLARLCSTSHTWTLPCLDALRTGSLNPLHCHRAMPLLYAPRTLTTRHIPCTLPCIGALTRLCLVELKADCLHQLHRHLETLLLYAPLH